MNAVQFHPQSLYDLSHEQLANQLTTWGEPAFRAKQIWRWLYQRNVGSIDEMTDLSKSLRAKLSETYGLGRLTPVANQVSSDGWTRKWLFRLPDGREIETVLMEYEGARRTACISSQAGCAMNCSFCATGQMGFLRNLTASEIVEQVLWVNRQLRIENEKLKTGTPNAQPSTLNPQLTNVVLMGMGEPFANYNPVMTAIARMTEAEDVGGIGLGARKVTVSTVGLVQGIRKFADEGGQVNLAVSLHAGTDELRNKLVPINERYPLEMLTEAIRDYINSTNRRVSFEWALIEGVNDTVEQAHALVDVVRQTYDPRRERRHMLHVNMIPLNPTAGYAGLASQRDRIARFCAVLDAANVPNTVRVRRGIDIAAGCGQLKAKPKATQKSGF